MSKKNKSKNLGEALRYIKGTVSKAQCTIHYENNENKKYKYDKVAILKQAEKQLEQAKKYPDRVNDIIELTTEFLGMIGMIIPKDWNPIVEIPPRHFCRDVLMKKYELANKGDVIWMSFTKPERNLVVVAKGYDIENGFKALPESKEHYNDTTNGKPKSKANRWKYSSQQIILHHLQKEFDESFILLFPLINIPDEIGGIKKAEKIECGIGNYLIDKGIPILDYYGHKK